MKNIRMIAFDIDGTLTDGSVLFGSDGETVKRFHISDGLGFRLAKSAGIKLAVISGRSCEAVRVRMQGLGVDEIHLGVDNKKVVIAQILAAHGLSVENIAFVGDDLNDIPAFQSVGVKIAVANAVPQLKALADYVTSARGGLGAGREAIEEILKAQGRLDEAIAQYVREMAGA